MDHRRPHHIRQRLPDHIGRRHADPIFVRTIGEAVHQIFIDEGDQHRQGVGHTAQFRFALCQRGAAFGQLRQLVADHELLLPHTQCGGDGAQQ
ncbi:hypothetical protein FE36_11725 [Xanthomonas oryzae pv. oryzicola]|nr:hypothetical protein FE36_11725 [Xanthomonas oryzae pv. oryzicola]